MKTFTQQSMQEILSCLTKQLQDNTSISFVVLNPDTYDEYAGKEIEIENIVYIYRSYKAWVDLAELLMCKMHIPKPVSTHLIEITFQKLKTDSFHNDRKKNEKYGVNSHFWHIHKMEEPAFLYYYLQALQNVKVASKKQVLNLGINRADEFMAIKTLIDTKKYYNINFIGIDHSASAIEEAKQLFNEENITFYTKDINDLDTLNLEKSDLLISIGTLQSSSIDFKPFFMHLVQNHLTKDASIILGFPNSRWIGGEVIYGAKAPNYAMSEQSLLYSDVIFVKKYLQQKKYRVTITGKQYVFLTATKIGLKQ
ncbi:MAG: methyltransferase domain-containing protein [Campylobacterota bacterium]|nr:methyltransferase domain-containing protein [Campylobacterota bacterium]